MKKGFFLLMVMIMFLFLSTSCSTQHFGVTYRVIIAPSEFDRTEAAIAEAEKSPGAKYCHEDPDKKKGKHKRGHGPRRPRQLHVQSVLDRTDIHTFQTAHAFITPHAVSFVDHDVSRADARTEFAIYTCRFGPGDFQRTEQLAIPRSAPYGQRNLHQKFLMNIESTNSAAITISENLDISAKK